ncbi:recombinase family protein [Rothia sp. CCM 9418]|uniref:recombinase family protein n=1 Tax=Rothia sp. CCM 9418 TaxID=3402661 RepID=UPI003AE8D7CF
MRRMLENERYKGCQLLQKTYRPHISTTTRTPNTGQVNQYWVEGALPAIIDPDTFDAVQTEIAHRRDIGPAATPSKNTGCFTSLIQCATCGCCYQRKTRTYPSGTSYKYWRCWSACKGKGNPCGGHNLRETMLQTLMIDLLDLEVFDPQAVMDRIEVIEAFRDRLDIHLTDGSVHTAWLDAEGHARS